MGSQKLQGREDEEEIDDIPGSCNTDARDVSGTNGGVA